MFYNRDITSEPVPILEILTDIPDETSLTFAFMSFLKQEQILYGNNVRFRPTLTTCDLPWPLLHSLAFSLNNESSEDYLERPYRILNGNANLNDLPAPKAKAFVHLCLPHFVKSISYKSGTFKRKTEKGFINFCCSLLANSWLYRNYKKGLKICLFYWSVHPWMNDIE